MYPDAIFSSTRLEDRIRAWPATLLLFCMIASARIAQVSLYGAAIPFFDQWDELNYKFRAWIDGSWHFTQLFEPLNEHRIAFTRLFCLGLFEANGRVFDNLAVGFANAVLYAGLWVLLYICLSRGDGSRWRRVSMLLVAMILGVLPFDWENVLAALQNAFYFMEIGAIALIAVCAYRKPSLSTWMLLTLMGVANLYTMASGMLAAPAVCAVVLMRAWREPLRPAYFLGLVGAMICITLFGLWLIPELPHDLYARGLAEYAHSLLIALSWPLEPLGKFSVPVAVILWAPFGIWLYRFWRTRDAEANEIVAAGIAAWVVLQFLAIAHARGHDMTTISSRYGEIPAIGLAANFWLALKLAFRVSASRRWMALSAIFTGTCLTACIFWLRLPYYAAELKYRQQYSQVETWHVRNYMNGVPLPVLVPGTPLLPYPDINVLRADLAKPDMRALLPPALFPHPDPSRDTPLSQAASALQQQVRDFFPNAVRTTALASFNSDVSPASAEATNAFCSMDWIDTVYAPEDDSIRVGDRVRFSGWYANDSRAAVPDLAIRLVGSVGRFATTIPSGDPRPDIVNALQSRAARYAGFSTIASTSNVLPDTYRILLEAVTGQRDICDTHRKLIVLP